MQREQLRSDPAAFNRALAEAGSMRELARRTGIGKTTIRRWRDNHAGGQPVKDTGGGKQSPGVKWSKDYAEIVGDLRTHHASPDDLIRQHGLNPDEWTVVSCTLNEWTTGVGDGEATPMAQLKVTIKRKQAFPFELPTPKPAGWKARSRKPKPSRDKPRYLIWAGDTHAPNHEAKACEHLYSWMEHHASQVVCVCAGGDTVDNNPFGRHRVIPRTAHGVTEGWQGGYDHLADLTAHVPHARRVWLCGNHDHWPVQRAREIMPALTDATLPGMKHPILDPRTYLRLDDLGFEAPGTTDGEYHDATVELLPDLVGLHGVATGPLGGAVKEVEAWEGVTIVQGHDHKLGMFLVTRRMTRGRIAEHWAISAGTLASKDQGYDPKRKASTGWLIVVLHPDGSWAPVFAHYRQDSQATVAGEWWTRG